MSEPAPFKQKRSPYDPEYDVQVVAWGSSKDEALAQLDKVKAEVTSNAGDVIVANVGPAGLTRRDGMPATERFRVEFRFKNRKLIQKNY